MSDKTIHIVFQVLNFFASNESDDFLLTANEKILLLFLAKHKGKKGIYPSVLTLAKELKRNETSIRRSLACLVKKKLIFIEYHPGKSSVYSLHFVEDLDSTPGVDAPPCVDVPRAWTPGHPGRGRQDTPGVDARQSDKRNNPLNNTERARKERAPLPNDFQVDQKTGELIKSLSFTKDEAFKIGIAFSEYFLDNGEARKDWQFEARKWFRRERKILDSQGKNKKLPAPVLPQRDTYGDRTDEPSGDPILAREFIKNIKKQFKSHGGLANGVLEKIRGDDEGG